MLPTVKASKGIHVLHLFYNIDREVWNVLDPADKDQALANLEELLRANSAASHPRIVSYANIGGKSDLVFMISALELGHAGQLHRDLEASFPAGSLAREYSFFSITELPEYVTTEEDMKKTLVEQEKLAPESEAFQQRLKELRERQQQYEQYRLYPELPDWEIMAFYPMSKRRAGQDNWYSLDFAARKKLMAGHARVGRKYAGRISQLITGSTGLDDWEWGVTLMAHQTDALKEIVYEMRFDEVSARYGDFGPFYVNLRLSPADLWKHLHL